MSSTSRTNSRNGSPEIRHRLIREDDSSAAGSDHPHHHSRPSRRITGDDYAELIDEDGDYSTPSGNFTYLNLFDLYLTIFKNYPVPNYELPRQHIDLQEIIGYGHFGDVHRGIFTNGGEQTLVAVKTCKDQTMADKFLEEACTFLVPSFTRFI